MCETKIVLFPLSLSLILAASFGIFQAHTEKNVGHHSKIKSKSLGKNE